MRVRRQVEEITAQLSDVLEARTVPACDVVPELVSGKFFPDDDRAAAEEKRAGGRHPARRMVERQTIVHAIRGARIDHTGKGMTREHQAIMIDVGGLWQPGRAGGVDVKGAILDGENGALRSSEVVAGISIEAAIDARVLGSCIPLPT